MHSERNLTSLSIDFFLECTSVESTLYKHWQFTVLIIRVVQTLGGPCTFTVEKLLFRQSEEGWACCISNTVQTLVFHSRLLGLNRHWIDLVHLLSVNYFFHSWNRVGPIVLQHCTNVGNQQSISYIGPTFNRSSQSAECHDFCSGIDSRVNLLGLFFSVCVTFIHQSVSFYIITIFQILNIGPGDIQ